MKEDLKDNKLDLVIGFLPYAAVLFLLIVMLDYILGSKAASSFASLLKIDIDLIYGLPFVLLIAAFAFKFIWYTYLDPRNKDFDTSTGKQKLLNGKLRKAAQNNDLQGVKMALKEGAQINSRGRGGRTALINAISSGPAGVTPNFEIVKYLVENGADVNIKDGFGRGPLQYTYSDLKEYYETIDYLQKHGAKGFSNIYYVPQ